jgi:predicted dehydrogenase
MKLPVGVIGLGDAWESRHRPALRAMSDRFDVVAICAEVGQLAQQAAGEFEAAVVEGFRSLVSRDDIEAILILSPEWYGPLPILAACRAGKAVYCASALNLAADRAIEVRERVEESGIAFMAELPRRHAPATVRLRELIASRLGQPWLLLCHGKDDRSLQDLTRSTASRYRPATGDSQWQTMLELVDWCHYISDRKVTSVLGEEHHADRPNKRWKKVQLGFANGELTAEIFCGRTIPRGWQEAVSYRSPAALQVSCENGVAFLDLPSTLVWFDEAGRHTERLDQDRPVGEQMLMLFHRRVTSLVRNTDDLRATYHALALIDAARQSAEEGRRLDLDS